MPTYTLTIAGRSVPTAKTFDVLNPADGSVVAACPEATPGDVDAAVAAARSAFPQWSALADAERVAKLTAIANLIEQHSQELSELVTREQGKTQSGLGANFEVGGAVVWTRVTAGLALPEETIQDDAAGKITVHRKPVGVVGSITPWNWPLMIAVWHVMPALRVGCTVVIKPSPFTPLSTLRLVSLMQEVLPAGVVNVVTGGAEDLVDALGGSRHGRSRDRQSHVPAPGHRQDGLYRIHCHRQEGPKCVGRDLEARDARIGRQ